MPQVTKHNPGTPSWADLSTIDDAEAVKFYGSLFGWTDDPQEMGPDSFYHIQRIEGHSEAGIAKQGEEEGPRTFRLIGTPISLWKTLTRRQKRPRMPVEQS